MPILWHPAALDEADAAAGSFSDKRPGLQFRFLDSLEATLQRIQRFPSIQRRIEDDVRKARIPHFPYAIIYRVRPEHLEIVAVMHLRRDPGYWKGRLDRG